MYTTPVGGRRTTSIVHNLFARIGLASTPAIIKAAIVPGCTLCAAYPLIATTPALEALLFSSALGGITLTMHELLPVLAPLNLLLLWLNFRRHRHAAPVWAGAIGVIGILAHVATHYLPVSEAVGVAFVWFGSFFLFVAAVLDWRARRLGATCGLPRSR